MTKGERIRAARLMRKLTAEQLGDAVGLTALEIELIEFGASLPNAMLRRIARALGVTYASLAFESPARADTRREEGELLVREGDRTIVFDCDAIATEGKTALVQRDGARTVVVLQKGFDPDEVIAVAVKEIRRL